MMAEKRFQNFNECGQSDMQLLLAKVSVCEETKTSKTTTPVWLPGRN